MIKLKALADDIYSFYGWIYKFIATTFGEAEMLDV